MGLEKGEHVWWPPREKQLMGLADSWMKRAQKRENAQVSGLGKQGTQWRYPQEGKQMGSRFVEEEEVSSFQHVWFEAPWRHQEEVPQALGNACRGQERVSSFQGVADAMELNEITQQDRTVWEIKAADRARRNSSLSMMWTQEGKTMTRAGELWAGKEQNSKRGPPMGVRGSQNAPLGMSQSVKYGRRC